MEKDLIQSVAYRLAHFYDKRFFNLKHHIIIKVTASKKFEKSCFALYEESFAEFAGMDKELPYHKITVSLGAHWGNMQELKNSIFHELAHAKQVELKIDCEHDRYFWEWEAKANEAGCTIRFPRDNYEEFFPTK